MKRFLAIGVTALLFIVAVHVDGWAASLARENEQREWHKGVGLVVEEPKIGGESPETAFSIARIRYQDYYGRVHVASVFLPPKTQKGEREQIAVSRHGTLWVKNGLGDENFSHAPHRSGPWYSAAALLILIIVCGFGGSWTIFEFIRPGSPRGQEPTARADCRTPGG